MILARWLAGVAHAATPTSDLLAAEQDTVGRCDAGELAACEALADAATRAAFVGAVGGRLTSAGEARAELGEWAGLRMCELGMIPACLAIGREPLPCRTGDWAGCQIAPAGLQDQGLRWSVQSPPVGTSISASQRGFFANGLPWWVDSGALYMGLGLDRVSFEEPGVQGSPEILDASLSDRLRIVFVLAGGDTGEAIGVAETSGGAWGVRRIDGLRWPDAAHLLGANTLVFSTQGTVDSEDVIEVADLETGAHHPLTALGDAVSLSGHVWDARGDWVAVAGADRDDWGTLTQVRRERVLGASGPSTESLTLDGEFQDLALDDQGGVYLVVSGQVYRWDPGGELALLPVQGEWHFRTVRVGSGGTLALGTHMVDSEGRQLRNLEGEDRDLGAVSSPSAIWAQGPHSLLLYQWGPVPDPPSWLATVPHLVLDREGPGTLIPISGRVTQDGHPVAGATVTAYPYYLEDISPKVVRADSHGQFLLDLSRRTDWLIEAWQDGSALGSAYVRPEFDSAELALAIEPVRACHIRVLDETGKPLVDHEVAVKDHKTRLVRRTSRSGELTVSLGPRLPGDFGWSDFDVLTVHSPGGFSGSVVLGDTCPTELRASVKDVDTRVPVQLEWPDGRPVYPALVQSSEMTDASGRVVVTPDTNSISGLHVSALLGLGQGQVSARLAAPRQVTEDGTERATIPPLMVSTPPGPGTLITAHEHIEAPESPVLLPWPLPTSDPPLYWLGRSPSVARSSSVQGKILVPDWQPLPTRDVHVTDGAGSPLVGHSVDIELTEDLTQRSWGNQVSLTTDAHGVLKIPASGATVIGDRIIGAAAGPQDTWKADLSLAPLDLTTPTTLETFVGHWVGAAGSPRGERSRSSEGAAEGRAGEGLDVRQLAPPTPSPPEVWTCTLEGGKLKVLRGDVPMRWVSLVGGTLLVEPDLPVPTAIFRLVRSGSTLYVETPNSEYAQRSGHGKVESLVLRPGPPAPE